MLPEGYGLVGTPTKTSYYEPLLPQSTRACTDGLQIDHPIQYTLACAAKENAITIASNIFVELPNNTRRITEIVYSADGESVAVYDKHHLFPGESMFFTPGSVELCQFPVLLLLPVGTITHKRVHFAVHSTRRLSR